ncbi:MAG: sensor histidine kinase, partial [Bacteroidota bacterium]|nr:sensor histidine kinase [Bacteroidota bacterium]
MNFNKDQRFIRWFIIFAAVVITALILWNVSLFFDQLKQAERDRMEIWATSMEAFNTEDINQYYALSQKINSKNQYIPIIITDYKDSIVNSINIPENILENPIRSQELLLEMAAENDPIRIDILGGELWYAYYRHSPVINQLKFFPVVLVIIVILFIAVIYFFYATSK